MSRVPLQRVVDRLEAIAPAQIDVPRVQEVLADGELDERELQRYVTPRSDRYARNLVHRSKWFDVIVLTWMPGQLTPIHNHAGNLGWVRLVRGRIQEERFVLEPSAAANGLDLAANVLAPPHGIQLRSLGSAVVDAIGAVATVDRQRAIHRLGNPREHARDEIAVTLHVYSKPHDACLAFDPSARTCTRRQLAFDNAAAM